MPSDFEIWCMASISQTNLGETYPLSMTRAATSSVKRARQPNFQNAFAVESRFLLKLGQYAETSHTLHGGCSGQEKTNTRVEGEMLLSGNACLIGEEVLGGWERLSKTGKGGLFVDDRS